MCVKMVSSCCDRNKCDLLKYACVRFLVVMLADAKLTIKICTTRPFNALLIIIKKIDWIVRIGHGGDTFPGCIYV